LTDRYKWNGNAPNTFEASLLTPGTCTIEQPGRAVITVEDTLLALQFDAAVLELRVETVAPDDQGLRASWGGPLTRLVLSHASDQDRAECRLEFHKG
jgi:hypothetical protein